MTRKSTLTALLQVLLIAGINAQSAKSIELAKNCFRTIDSLCAVDGAKLWGVPLCGPTLIVSSETREVFANTSDSEGNLKVFQGVHFGYLPSNVNVANTATGWAGVKWTMVMLESLSNSDRHTRNQLLLHESWHRIQEDLGVKPVMSQNAHLDGLQGRVLLKLEFEALRNALLAQSADGMVEHFRNSVHARLLRQQLNPSCNEDIFELHEGLPEYTGYKLCGLDEVVIRKVVAKRLENALNMDGFSNSFAYLTGPARGFIFDILSPSWRSRVLNGDNLSQIAIQTVGFNPAEADSIGLQRLFDFYKFDSLIKAEYEKQAVEDSLIEFYQQKLFLGNQLIIANNGVNFSFNPQEKVVPLKDGVVCKTMRLVGEWGVLEVSDGIFRANSWQYFVVQAPQDLTSQSISWGGYNLTLNKEWKIVQVAEGKYALSKAK